MNDSELSLVCISNNSYIYTHKWYIVNESELTWMKVNYHLCVYIVYIYSKWMEVNRRVRVTIHFEYSYLLLLHTSEIKWMIVNVHLCVTVITVSLHWYQSKEYLVIHFISWSQQRQGKEIFNSSLLRLEKGLVNGAKRSEPKVIIL